MEREAIKRVPYGVSDFLSVQENHLYYVDKSMYLPLLEEQPPYLFFIRPHRFGKSLFISMMRAYYDKAMAGRFDDQSRRNNIPEKSTKQRVLFLKNTAQYL